MNFEQPNSFRYEYLYGWEHQPHKIKAMDYFKATAISKKIILKGEAKTMPRKVRM